MKSGFKKGENLKKAGDIRLLAGFHTFQKEAKQ